MITYNADGSIQTIIQGESGIIRRDPWFVGPLPVTSSPKGTDFNAPNPGVATWFAEAVNNNLNDLGSSIYELGTAGYNRVATNADRIVESSKSAARSFQSGLASLNPLPKISEAASSVGEFFQSTLTKVLVIVLIAAIAFIFITSFIQAKGGKFANA